MLTSHLQQQRLRYSERLKHEAGIQTWFKELLFHNEPIVKYVIPSTEEEWDLFIWTADRAATAILWDHVGRVIHSNTSSWTSLAIPMERFVMDTPFLSTIYRPEFDGVGQEDHAASADNNGAPPEYDDDEETEDLLDEISTTYNWEPASPALHAKTTSMTPPAKLMERFAMDPPLQPPSDSPPSASTTTDANYIEPDVEVDEDVEESQVKAFEKMRKRWKRSGARSQTAMYKETRIRKSKSPREETSPKRVKR